MKKDETDFINCTAFGKTAEAICKYSGKGKKLGVEGRIQTGSYQKQDGTKVYTTDVIVDHADILEFNQAPQQNGYQQQPPAYQQGYQSAMQNPPPQFQQPTVQSAQMAPQQGYQQPPQFQQQNMTQYQQPAPPQDGWMQASPQDENLPFG
jgi:single-strand DNA-binding protein